MSVTTLKNTRFAFGSDNRVCAATTTLINGNGGYTAAPAKSEDAQYPMTNLVINDRYAIHRTANALTGTFYVDFDFGSDVNIDVVGVHGLRRAAGQSSPSSLDIQFRLAATTYNGGAGGWTNAKTGIPLTGRDSVVQLPGVIRARYWRWVYGVGGSGGGFSVGQPYAGALSYDLGFLYTPGSSDTLVRARVRSRTMMGAPIITETGDERRVFALQFADVDKTAVVDVLRAVARQTVPITLITPFDEAFQVELSDDQHEFRHDWSDGRVDLTTSALLLESLP